MSNTFVPLTIPRASAPAPISLAREAPIWSSARSVGSQRFHDAVTHVSFSPTAPHHLASSSGPSISLVSSWSGALVKSFTRFRDVAYSPRFRYDGRLLVAGSGDGVAKVFDVTSRAPLRVFKGHSGAVRTAHFSADGLNVLTGSDDTTVRVWDLATAKTLMTLSDSSDYIRSQSCSPVSPHVWAVGSADGQARLYDLRNKKVVFTLVHGSCVDALHMLPGGVRVVTAGGPDARVWDLLAGGEVVANFACHAKATTDVAVDAQARRLVTAGLDGYVKIHDLKSMQTTGIIPAKGQVLAVDVAPDGRRFGLGLAHGVVDVVAVKRSAVSTDGEKGSEGLLARGKAREFEGWGRGFVKVLDAEEEEEKKEVGSRSSKRYFMRGVKHGAADGDAVVQKSATKGYKLADYDVSLRKFEHARALDQAVGSGEVGKVVAVVDELMGRERLIAALGGRDWAEMVPLLKVIHRHVRKAPFAAKLVLVLNCVLDLYGAQVGHACSEADRLLARIGRRVALEVRLCRHMWAIEGGAQMVLWSARSKDG